MRFLNEGALEESCGFFVRCVGIDRLAKVDESGRGLFGELELVPQSM